VAIISLIPFVSILSLARVAPRTFRQEECFLSCADSEAFGPKYGRFRSGYPDRSREVPSDPGALPQPRWQTITIELQDACATNLIYEQFYAAFPEKVSG
jgi:hypothetical protein